MLKSPDTDSFLGWLGVAAALALIVAFGWGICNEVKKNMADPLACAMYAAAVQPKEPPTEEQKASARRTVGLLRACAKAMNETADVFEREYKLEEPVYAAQKDR